MYSWSHHSLRAVHDCCFRQTEFCTRTRYLRMGQLDGFIGRIADWREVRVIDQDDDDDRGWCVTNY